MPKMVKFLLENAVVGIVAGWVLLAFLLGSDSYGIGTVVFASANPVLPVFLLMFGFAVTFGSAAMGIAMMTLPYLQGGAGNAIALQPCCPVLSSMASWFKTQRQ